MIRKIWSWPGDTVAHGTSPATRRNLASWAAILMILTLPIRYLFKDQVWMVWALSEAAFILALLSIAAAETPVEIDTESVDIEVNAKVE